MAGTPNYVAINYISCEETYKARFEELFATRARAIDRVPGFIDMQVLRPQEDGGEYLIVSHWANEASFKSWTQSPEFAEGHKRGFEDLERAKADGKTPPMRSSFRTYRVIST